MKQYLNKHSFYLYAVVVLLACRGVLNAVIPLMDKTEARYAEIARIMCETGNWITPQIDYGVPFWAKPPLSTWLSALSFKIFVVNEFTARLPYLVLTILLVLLIGKYAKKDGLPFFLPGFVLLTIPESLLHAGVVSTDTSLAFAIALTMLSFWQTIESPQKSYWRYLIFVGLGLGLLAKGPIVFVLTIPPILIWSVIHHKIIYVIKKIPWFLGFLIVICIAGPWYFLAEQKTPGFIDYFVVGEHFKRFFDSNWTGDKYGFPKTQPIGIIWVFMIAFTIPWGVVLIKKAWQHKTLLYKNKWLSFLLLWFLWTPVFFTVSKSLIHPYILPVMVPLALLITHWWKNIAYKTQFVFGSLLVPVIALFIGVYTCVNNDLNHYYNTDKYLVEDIDNQYVYYINDKSYSSQFYSDGMIQEISLEVIKQKTFVNNSMYLIAHDDLNFLSKEQLSSLLLIKSNNKKGVYRYTKKR